MHARATTPQRFGAVAASAARPNGTVASRSVHESPRREGKLVRTRAPVPLLGLARPSTSRQTQQARSAAFRGRGAADPSRRPSLSTGLRSQGHKMWTRCGSVGPTGSCMLSVWPGHKHKGTLHEPFRPALVILASRCTARTQLRQRRPARQVSAAYPPNRARAHPSSSHHTLAHTHVEAQLAPARANDASPRP